MFKNLSYKQKNQLLLMVVPLFLIVSYQLSIKRTFEAKEACERLEVSLNSLEQAATEKHTLEAELASLERQIGQGQTNDYNLQTKVLKIVNDYCYREGITVKNFSEPEVEIEENYRVETTAIEINGPYVQLLKLAYAFEQEFRLGKLVSLRFEVQKNKKDKKNELIGTLFIRNIRKIDNENL